MSSYSSFPQHQLITENWRSYSSTPLLLSEGLNAKDLLIDVLQIAADTGAIAVTAGLGGDTLVDVVVAIDVGTDAIKEVDNLVSEAGEIGSVLTAAAKLDLSADTERFYNDTKDLLKRVVANQIAGETAKEFIESAASALKMIVSRLVRAIGKWVSALLPDDFGLAGPAFESTIGTAIKAAVDNAYVAAEGALGALGDTAKLITSGPALQEWLVSLLNQMIAPLKELQEVLATPDPEKQGWFKSGVASLQKRGEEAVESAIPTFLQWGRELGLDIDTSWEDYLEMMGSLPNNNPIKIGYEKGLPYLIDWLEGLRDETVPKAAAIMHKLISALFAALGLLQMLSNDDEREEILSTATRTSDLDPAGISDMDFDLGLREQKTPQDMKVIMETWRRFSTT